MDEETRKFLDGCIAAAALNISRKTPEAIRADQDKFDEIHRNALEAIYRHNVAQGAAIATAF